ncbi:hypothetical protein [Chamaesiphon sp. GL140_3_metabinner_50]|uniref:hypothetical protein n=1 Tax=Chamaesiphon sp. GL140_3_metabinner_50 TaxID=2970812 RepID=UPI0025E17E72|nr:hypothetical protein [Chamaesiphon sp. GL140_3_metabinner_50]
MYHQELGGNALFDRELTEAGMNLGNSISAGEFESMWDLSNKKSIESLAAIESKTPVKN